MRLRIAAHGEVSESLRREIEAGAPGCEWLAVGPDGSAPAPPHLVLLGRHLPDGPPPPPPDDPPLGGAVVAAEEDFAGADFVLPREEGARRRVLASVLKLARLVASADGPPERGFAARVDHEFRRAVRYRHPLSLLLLALDHVESLQRAHGSQPVSAYMGLLEQSAARAVRDTDLVFRIGGGEMAVLLPETAAEAAAIVGERLRGLASRLVVKPTPGDERPALPFKAAASAGVVDCPRVGIRSASDLESVARGLVATARAGGGNRVLVAGADPSNP